MSQDSFGADRPHDVLSNAQGEIAAPDNRRYPRVECLASALVEYSSWHGKKNVDGIIHSASVKSLTLELGKDIILNQGDAVTVRWKIPTALGLSDHPLECTTTGVVVRARTNSKQPNFYGIRFDHFLNEQIRQVHPQIAKFAIALIGILLGVDIVLLKIRNLQWFWYSPLFQAYSVMVGTYILSKVLCAIFLYKEPKDQGYTPKVTVLIAAKNEEKHITETVRHCFASHYPADKLEVFVVDDGSTDKTWEVIQDLQKQFPSLSTHRFETNRGKRHAMALGAEKAKGDVIVYIDSDSAIEPQGIYKLVQPLADKRVGAVAGHCLVQIEDDNFLSKMEAFRYYISQRLMKAAESVFGSVQCCPGPFSAYRRGAVLKNLKAWQFQQFLGTYATFGDDRSLTNFLLRDGYRVVFHNGAIVKTYVPSDWKTFFRQQLRWKKSWFRETLIASRFMWKKSLGASLPYYAGVLLTLLSPIVALHALVYLPIFLSISSVSYIAGLVLINVFFSCLYYYYTRSPYWYYSLWTAAVYLGFLCWQTYYAMWTVRRNHWGTR